MQYNWGNTHPTLIYSLTFWHSKYFNPGNLKQQKHISNIPEATMEENKNTRPALCMKYEFPSENHYDKNQ